MILDRQNQLCAGQAITGTDGYSTDAIDLGAAVNISRGKEKRLFVKVDGTAFAGGTSLEVQYVQSSNANLSSHDVLATTGAIAVAALTANATLMDLPLPSNTKRYVGLRFDVTGTMSAGSVSGWIVDTTDTGTLYEGYTGR